MKDVLVYNGDGVSPLTLAPTVQSLRAHLGHRHDVKYVGAKALINDPWPESTALLVITGGRDLAYLASLGGTACDRIAAYVRGGGSYLGLCAGGYFGSARISFEPGTPLEVVGDRPLAFYRGTARGSVFPGFQYNSESGARAARIKINTDVLADSSISNGEIRAYCNGGCTFETDADADAQQMPLAWYADDGATGPAIVECRVGSGVAVLSGVHFELDSSHVAPAGFTAAGDLDADARGRAALMAAVLRRLGLAPRAEADTDVTPTNLALVSRTPLAADALWARISSSGAATRDVTGGVPDISYVIDERAAERTESGKFPAASLPLRIFRASSLGDLDGASFDSALFFDLVQRARASTARPGLLSSKRFGDHLLYGHVVASTQSLLEKNFALSQSLPDGVVCTATRQVAGRGRSGNAWVSPAGCLLFSVLARHARGETVAFVQYLMAMAVVEAVRGADGYGDLPLYIKWPNDVYAREEGEGGNALRKIGGVLVTSSFADGQFLLVIGTNLS